MLTLLAILGMLFAGYLFWAGHVTAGLFVFLASWVAAALDD